MKFELYHSESEQSYTLIKKGANKRGQLEPDAKLIHKITAKDWTGAVAKQEQLLYKESK